MIFFDRLWASTYARCLFQANRTYKMNAPIDSEIAARAAEISPGTQPWQYLSEGTAVSQDGYKIKNVDKIEAVTAGMDCRVEARFYSWQISREMRRDFHLLSRKIFLRARNETFRQNLRDLLLELRMQATFVAAEAESYEKPQFPFPQVVPFRIVSKEGSMLYKICCEADLPIAILTEASKSGRITQQHSESMIEPFMLAYKDLKHFLMGQATQSTKTAAELGKEGGIT